MEENEQLNQPQPLTQEALTQLMTELIERLENRMAQTLEGADKQLQDRVKQLDERESELQSRALKTTCEEALKERGLPPELSDALAFSKEEDVEPVVTALEAAFRAAVQQGVEARLKGETPKTGVAQNLRELPDEAYYAAVLSENCPNL